MQVEEKRMLCIFYYDGPYIDSGLSPEEREQKVKESLEADKELTDWPELD